MRRNRLLMMMLAALLVWGAARVVPQALGLATATVNFGGNLRVNGGTAGITRFVTCTSGALTPNPLKNKSGTVSISCTNNLDVPVTVSLSLGALTASPSTPPIVYPTVSSTSFSVNPRSTAAANLLMVTATNKTSAKTYTQAFTIIADAGNGLGYSTAPTVTFQVQ